MRYTWTRTQEPPVATAKARPSRIKIVSFSYTTINYFASLTVERVRAVVEVRRTVVLAVVLRAQGEFPDQGNGPVQIDISTVVFPGTVDRSKAAVVEAKCLL